jgi:hypothetical protein
VAGFGWGLREEDEHYLRGGAPLDPRDGFAQGVFWSWARAESPGSVAVLELRTGYEHWRAGPTAAGLAELTAQADAAGIPHGVPAGQQVPDEELLAAAAPLEQAIEQLFWRDWAVFEHRLAECRAAAPASSSGGEVADQAYHWVVERLSGEDPEFAAQLAGDPALASAIYAEAVRRFGQYAH